VGEFCWVFVKLLKMMGCDLIQGFLFAPPLKENIMLQLVATGFADTPAFAEP